MNSTTLHSKPFQLIIFKSNQHIYAQLLDPNTKNGHILITASTLEKSYRSNFKKLSQIEDAKKIGQLIGQRAQQFGINTILIKLKKKKDFKKKFSNRKTYPFHGKIKALILEILNLGISIKKD